MMYFAYPEEKINFMRENLLFFFKKIYVASGGGYTLPYQLVASLCC